jgi:ribonucleoside-diphosphate reductase alpha chain/ribonucleoside-triphosphate reductase
MNNLGKFVYYRTYSRLKDNGDRETWEETVKRAVDYNCNIIPTCKQERDQLYNNIINLKQFLSGRTFWVGGTKVSELFPMANYNCSFQILDSTSSLSEIFYLLLLGCGVGIRLLKEDVEKLPKFRTDFYVEHKIYGEYKRFNSFVNTDLRFNHDNDRAFIIIGDSKEGWVQALRFYIDILTRSEYRSIKNLFIDYRDIREEGTPLKTFGGYASGPEPLIDMFKKITEVIKNSGGKLKPIDCLDMVNLIGNNVVVGGVRRTAEVILIDSDDKECIKAKDTLYKKVGGNWEINDKIMHRQMSNNSIFYKTKPTKKELHKHLLRIRHSGEPGFVNNQSAIRRFEHFKGLNPCAEVLLPNRGLCNLVTVNMVGFVENQFINLTKLKQAMRLAVRSAIRITLQELELHEWDRVQQRHRLIGVSLTGWQDMVNMTKCCKEAEKELLQKLRDVAHSSSEKYCKELDIAPPELVTTIKPEGTLSILPGVSSGIHYSHAPFYIRRVRINANDSLVNVMEDLGYNIRPEVGQNPSNPSTKVIEFPCKAPRGRTKSNITAIEQLENYKTFMENYVDHNVSITVHVRDNEWQDVEDWLFDNWDSVVAVSFISLNDNFYDLMPYEEITREQYEEMVEKIKPFEDSLVNRYEKGENHDVESDCEGGVCPVR